ncbi:MAG: xanthine dehydrogenase family protein molybdopterin-binding subunit [Deltaproteobacteria bacterium]|nr:xanthine dehydrogenase family protein molybdopterin-binding subunit [Deltaproteobacteria bacterium]
MSKDHKKHKLVGTPIKRKEDPEILLGRARYTQDISLPQMLYAAIYRSPYAHARIKQVDLTRALQLPGVVTGLTGQQLRDIAYLRPMSPFPFQSRDPFRKGNPTIKFFNHYCLATDKVRFIGEPVAAVVATSRYIAEDALELIDADFDPLPPVLDTEEAQSSEAALLYEEWGDNVMLTFRVSGGDVDSAFSQADLVVKEKIQSGRFTGTPIETRAVLASFDPNMKVLTIWDTTQIGHPLSTLIQDTIALPDLKVHVNSQRIGGGFGQKWAFYPEEVLIPLLSISTQRPVKWVETRREHMTGTVHAREQSHVIEAAVRKDGTILGIKDRITANVGAAYPTGGLASIVTTGMFVPGAYKIPSYEGEVLGVVTNKTPYGAHRGFGKSEACFVIERLVDIIAERLDLDPTEVRFRNFIPPEAFPYISVTGPRYDSGNYAKALRKALDLAEYPKWKKEQEQLRRQGRYVGIGTCLVVEPSSSTRMGSYNAGYYSVRMRVDANGKVYVFPSGSDEGQGHATSISQLVSDELQVPFDDVFVVEGDSLACPYGSGSYSSRFSVVGTAAVTLAARQLRERILRIASVLLGKPPQTLDLSAGRVHLQNNSAEGVSLTEVARTAYFSIFRLPEGVEPGLEVLYHYRDPNIEFQADERGRVAMFSSFPYDAEVAVVEVDIDIGLIKFLTFVSVHDCGNMLNPLIVKGQHIGSLAHGFGGAIYEELLYDDDGRLLSSSFKDYFVPTVMEIPDMVLDHITTPNPFTPGGFKGAGETGTVGPPAVVANAVEDALRPFGVKIRKVPLSPFYLWSLIEQSRRLKKTSMVHP